jgi:hypothetical protein
MTIKWERDKGILQADGVALVCRSDVRNEINARRRLHESAEVRYGVLTDRTRGPAYMPRAFPLGTFAITDIEIIADQDSDFYPVKIMTDATQRLEEWILDDDGGYDRPSGRYFVDAGYHLHFDPHSRTTLGCGRVGTVSPAQILRLAGILWEPVKMGSGRVLIEVV